MARSLDTKHPRPYICASPGCGRAFRSTSDRLRHEQIHLPAELRAYFVCTYQHCSKRYTQKRALQNHINYVHLGLKKHCRVEGCNALLVDDSSLWHHEQKIHRDILFSCDLCGYILHTQKSLKFHLMRCKDRSESPAPSPKNIVTGSSESNAPYSPDDRCHSDDGGRSSSATSVLGPSAPSLTSEGTRNYSPPPSQSTQSTSCPKTTPHSDLTSMQHVSDEGLNLVLTYPFLQAQPAITNPENHAIPYMYAHQTPPIKSVKSQAPSPLPVPHLPETPYLSPPQPRRSAGPSQPTYHPYSRPEASSSRPRHEQRCLRPVGSFSPVLVPSQTMLFADHPSSAFCATPLFTPIPNSEYSSPMLALSATDIESLFGSSNQQVEFNFATNLFPDVTDGAVASDQTLGWPAPWYGGMMLTSSWPNSLC